MLHIELKEQIEAAFDATQLASVTLCRDALELSLTNGVELTLRIADPSEYAMNWRWGEAAMGIDTAPVHPTLGTFPNHLHTPDGRTVDDPVSEVGVAPWHNVRRLIARLLAQPLLGFDAPFVHDLSEALSDES
ncbi:hypothetical protein E1N52_27280 [Paraburkholderia guartelaensis]|jgi:hypothetical protein|uniref:Uncharacterized protein n=1 Tax=Paraburkholderia guartelaensis TaxID=2546446 RepID=A0A4R5L7N3_9BURK|nr:hypothetical protein [Paraburkholderia guartelaensis]TDG04883.1 hypothetical protein E1N52_27280 [Paraburkholderia guartelaensis]